MRPYSEYLAMTQGNRIAALYAEIDDLIESSPRKETLRELQNAMDQIHFRSSNGSGYTHIMGLLERSMLSQSRLLDEIESKIGSRNEGTGSP